MLIKNDPVAIELRRLADVLDARLVIPTTIPVPAGGSIADAVAQLPDGGIITLTPGATYGSVILPKRPVGSPLITITTSGTLPERRITPDDAPILATIAGLSTDGALWFEETSGYKLDGIRLTMSVNTHEVVVIQDSQDITLDRILYQATPAVKRVVRGNGRRITLTRSYLDGGAYAGQDSQAFCAWEGSGPYVIIDNYLAASGENILFGGADNIRCNGCDNPADILVENNFIHKPEEWRQIRGSVKNLFELKNASRVVIRNNVFDGNWTDAQAGWAIVLTPMNQDGGAPWSIIKDVLFERNIVKNSERGINILGRSPYQVTQQFSGLVIRKNLFELSSQFILVTTGLIDMILEDNVVDQNANTAGLYIGDYKSSEGVSIDDPHAIYHLKWNRNVHRDKGYGIHSEVGIGTVSLETRTQTYEFIDNKFQGKQFNYPEGTLDIDEVAFQAAKSELLNELTSGK